MSNKIDRINAILASAVHHRDQLDAMATEFVQLHGAKPGSEDEEDLVSVILDGDDYRRVLLEIRRRYVRRHNKR